MSSEESGYDGVTLYRRPLPWMRSKYSNSLKALDKIYYNRLSAKPKGMVRQREEGEPSERPAPSSPLQFIVEDENQDPNSSVTSLEDNASA